jgi:hypothetical protein
MSGRSKTVVPFVPKVKAAWGAFGDLEPHICDLVRACDLAEFVHDSEASECKITDDRHVLRLVLEDLTRRTKDLRALYYQLHESVVSSGTGGVK